MDLGIWQCILISIFSYLMGSIPCGLIASKLLFKQDIRNNGSKNIGATNVGRVYGRKIGLMIFAADGMKGVIAIIISRILIPDTNHIVYISALFSVMGHIFPIWLKFKGGKGSSTAFAALAILDAKIFLIVCVIVISCICISRYISLASVISSATLLVIPTLLGRDLFSIITWILIGSLIIAKHHSNIKRLVNHTEPKITYLFRSKKEKEDTY